MRIKKYNGKDMQEALAKVRADLGVEAVILNSRKVKRRGIAAWFTHPYFEVLAAVDENFVPSGRPRRRPAETEGSGGWPRDAAPEGERAAGSGLRERSGSMADDRERLLASTVREARPSPSGTGTVLPLRPNTYAAQGRPSDADEPVVRTPYGAAAYAAASETTKTPISAPRGTERNAGRDPERTRDPERVRDPVAVRPIYPAGNGLAFHDETSAPIQAESELSRLKDQVQSMAVLLERLQEREAGVLPVQAERVRTPGTEAEFAKPADARQKPVALADAGLKPAVQNATRPEQERNPERSQGRNSERSLEYSQERSQGRNPERSLERNLEYSQERNPEHKQENSGMADRFDEMKRHLQDLEIDDQLAERIIGKVRSLLPADASLEDVRRQTGRVLAAALGEPETIRLRSDGKPTVVAFIGPTGVGKTTTLAKIAADFTLTKGRKVGLVTADTYRIAAVEQLKTYAEILNLPVSVVYSPQDMQAALAAHADKDIILVDTAGRSHRNRQQFDELRQLITAVPIDEVFLVLSVNTGRHACGEILEHYSFMKDYKLLFTKLDETPAPGVIFNARLRTGKPLSYVTAGQSVPDDLAVADPKMLAASAAGLSP